MTFGIEHNLKQWCGTSTFSW